MDTLVWLATHFIGMFQEGGKTFIGLVTGIVPTLIVLLTGVNALIALIGAERIERVGEWAARPGLLYYPVRYIILPVLAVFFLTNPMAYTMGRFLPERYKPAFYDAAVLAGFGRIENRCAAPVVIVGAKSAAFGEVSLHETRVVDGVSKMRPVPELRIAPDGAAVLKPGGLHLMLMQPHKPLKAGSRVAVEFALKDGGTLLGEFEVRKPTP